MGPRPHDVSLAQAVGSHSINKHVVLRENCDGGCSEHTLIREVRPQLPMQLQGILVDIRVVMEA